MRISNQSKATFLIFSAALIVATNRVHAEGDDPVVQSSKQSQALAALPPKALEQRIPVTIYEFHSGVPDVSVAAATDIFTTTLIESHQFRVVERNRLNQGVVYEKQLNGAGQATGDRHGSERRRGSKTRRRVDWRIEPGRRQEQGHHRGGRAHPRCQHGRCP